MPLAVKNNAIVRIKADPLDPGKLASDVACCCDDEGNECTCDFPENWRITDAEGNIYAQGPITTSGTPEGGNPCAGLIVRMEDFPQSWVPLFYWATGELAMKLEVDGCPDPGGWQTLESWDATISLCDDGRYPLRNLFGPWPPPPGCDCQNQALADADLEECVPCPDISPGSGDGQAWRDPQPGVGVTFTGAIDGEWSNLLNWEDANGLSPAASLPTTENVTIAADVTSASAAANAGEMTIEAGVKFSASASVADLHCYGAIERESICEGQSGIVLCGGQAFFYDGSYNNGEVSYVEGQFYGDAENKADGILVGATRFNDASRNKGLCNSATEFWDTSGNDGTVDNEATFNESSENAETGTVATNAIFNDAAINFGTVTQESTFNSESINDGSGVVGTGAGGVTYPAIFNGTATNAGTVNGVATFNESSQNLFTGTLFNDATFNNSSKNYGAATSGDIAFTGSSENHYFVGVTTFTDSAINKAAGVVAAGTFSGTSSNAGSVTVDAVFGDSATNSGTVGGFATFNDSAANNSGTVDSAEFNGSSTNSGTVTTTATFNDDTVNAAAGVVSTDATFNDDSINRGAVTGTATFNDCSHNDGGTAGTFVPDPPPDEYPC